MAFDTPEQLLGYLALHGETERALTRGEHINQLLELAGHPEGYVKSVDPERWFNFYTETSAPLIKLARERLSGKKSAVIIPFPSKGEE